MPLREAEGGNPEAPTRGTEDARGLHETIISNASIEAASYQGGNGGCGLAPPRRRRPNLHQLNANDVNAVFAEGQRAINSLRDVQVTTYALPNGKPNMHVSLIICDVVSY